MIEDKMKILIADDEKEIVQSIFRLLTREGYLVDTVTDGKAALEKIRKDNFDIVIADIVMPGVEGIKLLKEVKTFSPEIEVIILTGYGSVPSAVKAMKLGAFDYITKPFDNLELKIRIKNIAEKKRLEKEVERLKIQSNKPGPYYPDLIGFSKVMQKVYTLIEKIAISNCNLLITGETGTGKEVIAKVIHKNSPRKKGPFIPINCKAIPESVIENELFGHERGAYTDAKESKKGFFESADGGILFLDEITEISPGIQVKLLRSIEDKKIYRLGKTQPVDVNIRIIASTNRNVKEEIEKGSFREDLYFRLNVVTIHAPPLRERASDIPLLAEYFLKVFQNKMNKKIDGFHAQCFELFLKYHWPGNIRELANAVEHAVTISSDNLIKISDLPPTLTGNIPYQISPALFNNKTLLPFTNAKEEVIRHFCIDFISDVLMRTNGNITKATQQMNVARSYLNTLIKKHDIKVTRENG